MTDSVYLYDGEGEVPCDVYTIRVQNGVKIIKDEAFVTCKLLVSIHIPYTVEKIGNGAFSHCSNLVSVSLPSSIKEICGWAFAGCISLSSIYIPSSVTSIGEGAFFQCHSLDSINIPSSITTIRKWTFKGCDSFTSISLPSSIQKISSRAFDCKRLISITLHSNIDFISELAFRDCKSLRRINYQSNTAQTNNNNDMESIQNLNYQVTPTPYTVDSVSPLHFLLMIGSVFYYDDDIKNLICKEPNSLTECDPIYNMYPFLLAACSPRRKHDVEANRSYNEKQHLETVFVLLRQAPWVIDSLIPKSITR